MKKAVCMLLCFVALIFCGCHADPAPVTLIPGNYFAFPDASLSERPYLTLDEESGEFIMGVSVVSSYIVFGTYEVSDGTVTATSEMGEFTFEIKDGETLVFTGSEYDNVLKFPNGLKFYYYPELE